MNAMPTSDDWERQPNESEPAFVAYRDQETGHRSIRRAAAGVGKSETLVGRWSSHHAWPARVAAWDAERDCADRESQAKLAQPKIVGRLRSLRAEDLNPAGLIRWFHALTKVERLALGELTHEGERRRCVRIALLGAPE